MGARAGHGSRLRALRVGRRSRRLPSRRDGGRHRERLRAVHELRVRSVRGMRLKDRVVLLTEAGAGDSYGRWWALAAAREGARVAVADRDRQSAAKLASEVRSTGGEAVDLEIDVTSEESCRRAVEATIGAFGSIDVLVNNAHLWL